MQRYTGAVEILANIEVVGLVAWIQAIDLADWPQQKPLDDGQLRPAMVTDHAWHSFGLVTDPTVNRLMALFPGCGDTQRMLSVVMPGHSIPPHKDWQAPSWICRVHVPLLTNDKSVFIVDNTEYQLHPGTAYKVNTEAEHSVVNDGATPRIHFMFDVRRL